MFANNKNFNGDIRKWSFEHLGSATGIFDGADKFNAKWECGFKATGIIDFSSCQSSQTLKKQKKPKNDYNVRTLSRIQNTIRKNTVPGDAEPQSSAAAFDDESMRNMPPRESKNTTTKSTRRTKGKLRWLLPEAFWGGSSSSAAPKEEHELPTAAVTTSVSDDGDDESSSEQQRLPEISKTTRVS